MRRLVALLCLISGCAVGCGSSGAKGYANDCNAQCQRDLVALGGQRLPGGQLFDPDNSRCALWNEEPDVIRLRFTDLYAERYGTSSNPPYHFEQQFQKAITTSCRSYTGYRVARVVRIVHSLTGNTWPTR